MCGGRTAIDGGDVVPPTGDAAGSASRTPSGGASSGGAFSGGASGTGGICSDCTFAGAAGSDDSGAAGTAGEGGAPETLLVDDQPVSAPDPEGLPTGLDDNSQLSVSCSASNCLVVWISKLSARFARVTFDGTWLDPPEGRYLGRTGELPEFPIRLGIASASNGTQFALLWPQFSNDRRRWVIQRVQASSGELVDPQPVALSDWNVPQAETVALGWDGARYLAVLPRGHIADVLLLDAELQGAPGLRTQLSLASDFQELSVTSVEQGSFAATWRGYADTPGRASGSLFTYSDSALTASAFDLPAAPQHEGSGLDAGPNQYLFSWIQRGDTTLHFATRKVHDGTWQMGSAFAPSAAHFAFSGGVYFGVNEQDDRLRLDPATLTVLPTPGANDGGHGARIAATPQNSAILAHFRSTGAVHVHVLTRATERVSTDVGREATEQALRSLASDGSTYLVAWAESDQLWFRRFRPDMTPLDEAPWQLTNSDDAVPDLFHLAYANGRYLALWWFSSSTTHPVAMAAVLDPVARQLSHVQALTEVPMAPQELMSDGARAWVTLIEPGTKKLDAYNTEAWFRVATLDPGADSFALSERLSADGLAVTGASFAPLGTSYAAAWWEGGRDGLWPASTLHVGGYDSNLQLLGSQGLATHWPAQYFFCNETVSGLRIVGSRSTPNALYISDDTYDRTTFVGLANAARPSAPLKSLEPLEWMSETPPSVLELESGCWAVSGFGWSQGRDATPTTYRFCDRSGALLASTPHYWSLAGDRSLEDFKQAFYGATHDHEHTAFAFQATDPVLNARRVRFVVLAP